MLSFCLWKSPHFYIQEIRHGQYCLLLKLYLTWLIKYCFWFVRLKSNFWECFKARTSKRISNKRPINNSFSRDWPKIKNQTKKCKHTQKAMKKHKQNLYKIETKGLFGMWLLKYCFLLKRWRFCNTCIYKRGNMHAYPNFKISITLKYV